ELYRRHSPVHAPGVGIHDYDHQLPNDSPDGLRERTIWLRDLEQRLVAAVAWQELPTEQRIDYAQVPPRTAPLRADLEEIRMHERNPALYPESALNGIFLLMARPFAPLEERKEAILSRMIAVPDYLLAARENLKEVPEVYLGIASDINLSGPSFVDEVMRTLLKSFPGEAERIEHAAERARVGFLQYQEFMDRELETRVGGAFAIGEPWMYFTLERGHRLELDCQALEEIGRDHVEGTRRLLEEEAKKIDGSRTWRDLVAEGQKRHPAAPGR